MTNNTNPKGTTMDMTIYTLDNVTGPFSQFTGVQELLKAYRFWIKQYEEAKQAGHYGYATKASIKAHMIGKRLMRRFAATETYLTEVRNEAVNEVLAAN
jgi:hypothetical protein